MVVFGRHDNGGGVCGGDGGGARRVVLHGVP